MASTQKSKKKQIPKPRVSTELKPKAASAPPGRREPAPTLFRFDRQERRLVIGLLIVTFLAFVNALDGQFVYDDRFQVLKNPTINSLDNIPQMFTQSVWQFMSQASQEPIGAYYRPLFNIALILNHHFFGFDVFGWHVVSLFLHLVATLLIYFLSRQWRLSRQIAFAVALLFGLHPTHCESVAWVSGLPDPLAAVFVLSSLLLYERYYHGRGGQRSLLVWSVGLALLTMLSKEVAIVFPVFLVVREWFDRSPDESFAATVIRVAKRTAPFVAVAVLYIGLRYSVLGFLSKVEPKAVGIPTVQVFLTIPSILLSYARMLLIPHPLAITYDHQYVTSTADPRFWGAALALVAVIIGAVWLVRSSPVGRRALVWLILFLLPVLNLKAFNQDESLLHDRYLYLPSIGLCLLIGLALAWFNARFQATRKPALMTATILIGVFFFALTVYQNGFWQNDFVMANHALRLGPQRPFLLNYIGAYYSQQNKLAEAEQFYLEALKANPRYYDSLSNLADVYRLQGKYAEAEQAYRKAIECGAPYADTYYNLGVTYTSEGKLAEAEGPLLKALEIQPTNTAARYNLGWVYDNQGKSALAEQAYTETLRQKPSYPEPRINLGVLLTKQGRYTEALEQLQIVKRYAPGHPVLLYALGDVYLKTNRYQEAIEPLSQLARLEPQHRLVYTSLGLCYEALGNREQARAHFQKAIEVAPQDPYTNVAREHLAKLP
ncbi:MAG: tetratricopeptide repeat protein [Acidobacteria bacterium]|nr:tetratricopeptide repeat protein [Acidobacteriota bacterium]